MLKIAPESILPKKLEIFKKLYLEEDVAELHHKHH